MKFVYADSLDYVDPSFDFEADRTKSGRVAHRDDQYPHEILKAVPYDGILVSRAIVGDVGGGGKYKESQMMRFRREGARAFLRYPEARFPGSMVMGDCGAFSYRNQEKPPYGVEDTVEFYADGQFTHGCSVDHLIFDFDDGTGRKITEIPAKTRQRYELTLDLAQDFVREGRRIGRHFTPVGVVQGWSAKSMAEAAKNLARMGYTYIAIGGMVPLKIDQIHRAVTAIRDAVPPRVRLHLLGFGKIEHVTEFEQYGVTSFDTTSPLLRAFKDARKNYFHQDPSGRLKYYVAIRVPQATENAKLRRKAKEGSVNQEQLRRLEDSAMQALHKYARKKIPASDAVASVIEYWEQLNWIGDGKKPSRLMLEKQRQLYLQTLEDRPWEHCKCHVCAEAGIDVVIFRSSNRNKRRGIHNLSVFYKSLQQALAAGSQVLEAAA